ncbi:MAG: protein kinase [Cyanobacteria bacterium SID2]|nr:protein kinase [Cyanobacteria bacterium SID2]MBP0003437.1 protein kinase [Cyanobacteria bacterium SBC]
MAFCLNPHCSQPQNTESDRLCQNCGFPLLVADRYRAFRLLGIGGFSRTFLGVDEYKPSRPPCVIKQFAPDEGGIRNPEKAAVLFRQEAKRLENLGKHPNIPDLFAQFEWNSRQYLVQEFIDGQNLARELELNGRSSERDIIQLLQEILPVLQFVHDRNVIHRDIKPDNLIRGKNGRLYLVDFGASKLTTTNDLNVTGTAIGSAGYAAPEQTLGKATFASDIYSLGVTCVHLLTDIPPFDLYDSDDGKWVWRDYAIGDRPISQRFARILDKMLETGTGRRYRSASAVLEDLNTVTTVPRSNASSSTANSPPTPPPVLLEAEHRQRVRNSYKLWLLGFFLGTWFRPMKGLHRFYNGQILTGLLWMIPIIGDIGSLVDLVFMSRLVNEYEEKARAKLGVSSAGVPLQPQTLVTQTLQYLTKNDKTLKLIRSANARGGQISVTQAVMDTGMSFVEAESILTELVATGYVDLDSDPVSGTVVYRFREL